ncbi:phosphonoacetaldehyde hydrolase [Steroidobacter flavus]|uniref:Phosphonoacetaldehyde hydrolase n=1 Tax=Steroidobacter flavus TaxID=1842136 RepID=A0ABV8T5T4_9GAMM
MKPLLQAVIFDWAGTMIDFGSRAPVVALCELFAHAGVPVTEAEARTHMGMAKRDHIRSLLGLPRVAEAWIKRYGGPAKEADVNTLFDNVGPMMRIAARTCSELIPGAAAVATRLRASGMVLGSCTGYTHEMMEDILPRAAEQGYRPDRVVCAGDTPHGRPSPLMVWKNLVELGVWPASTCVKVDDTEVGIAEGLAAGVWTIGIAASGNGVGLSQHALDALAPAERAARVERARRTLMNAGAHLVIDTVADLPHALLELPIELPDALRSDDSPPARAPLATAKVTYDEFGSAPRASGVGLGAVLGSPCSDGKSDQIGLYVSTVNVFGCRVFGALPDASGLPEE